MGRLIIVILILLFIAWWVNRYNSTHYSQNNNGGITSAEGMFPAPLPRDWWGFKPPFNSWMFDNNGNYKASVYDTYFSN